MNLKFNQIRTCLPQALEDRLARRRQKIEMHQNDKEQERAEIDYRRDAHDKKLTDLVSDGKLNEKQKQDILDEYENDLRKVQMQHENGKQRLRNIIVQPYQKTDYEPIIIISAEKI